MSAIAVERKKAVGRWSESLARVSDHLFEFENASKHLQHLCDPGHSAFQEGHNGGSTDDGLSMEQTCAFLDDTFVQLEAVELQLIRIRQSLRSIRNNSLELVPISKLHPEILSYIFQLGVEQEQRDLEKAENTSNGSSVEDKLEAQNFAELVSQVSRYWRAVALDTAALWTKVDFSDPPPHDYTRIWIERSKRAPLDIHFRRPVLGLRGNDVEYYDGVVDILRPHISHITSLTIDSPNFEEMVTLLCEILRCGSSFLPLKSLVLIDQSGPGPIIHDFSIGDRVQQLNEMMSNLRLVNFEGIRLSYRLTTPKFKDLTSLRLVNMAQAFAPSSDDFRNDLLACPLLECLILDRSGINLDDVANTGGTVRMSSLHTLHIISIDWADIEYVLQLIEAPHLRELKISDVEGIMPGDRQWGERVMKAILQLLTAHQSPESPSPMSPLEHLYLDRTQTEPEFWPHYTQILQVAPNLRTLALYHIPLSDAFIESMSIPDGATNTRKVLCPSLTTLKLCHVTFVTFPALVAMLKSRAKYGKKLETVKAVEWPSNGPFSDTQAVIDELRPLAKRLVVILDGELM